MNPVKEVTLLGKQQLQGLQGLKDETEQVYVL
jgi:hypothetical protein